MAVEEKKTLKDETSFSGGIGQSLHSAVVKISASVKNHFSCAHGQCPAGDCGADHLGQVGFGHLPQRGLYLGL
jgi:hypothetical protein